MTDLIRRECYESRALMVKAERRWMTPVMGLRCWRHRVQWGKDDILDARNRRFRVGRLRRIVDGQSTDVLLHAFLRRFSLLNRGVFGVRA